jgi:hypothetical protein
MNARRRGRRTPGNRWTSATLCSCDYDWLGAAVARALSGLTLEVGVDNLHAGLLRTQRVLHTLSLLTVRRKCSYDALCRSHGSRFHTQVVPLR